MKAQSLAIVLTIILMVVTGAFADVPHHINFQGTLTDSAGNSITGSRIVQFFLYADSTGGIPLWMESHSSVEITDGLFRVTLGSEELLPDSLFDGSVLWLAIQVDPDPMPFSQRQPLNTVSYSFRSLEADRASHADSADYAAGLSLPYSGSVSSSSDAFSVTNTGSGDAADFQSSGGTGVSAHGSGFGVYATADEGVGVYGRSDFILTPGVCGYNSANGIGVSGSSSGNTGYLGTATRGVYGSAADSTGCGVYGTNAETGNYGYLGGESAGVYGYGDDLAGYFDGSVKIGSNGYPISEIKLIWGYTASTGYSTQISYPAGFEITNTMVFGTQIRSLYGVWHTTGAAVSASINISCLLHGTYIELRHAASSEFWNRPYWILLMKI